MGQTHVPIGMFLINIESLFCSLFNCFYLVSLTANVMPGIVEQCVQAGMDYCIFSFFLSFLCGFCFFYIMHSFTLHRSI